MLELLDVACVRGDRVLFSDISITLDRGALLRVTGANGSGKTSLLRIICGLSVPDHGKVRWAGESISTLREDYWKHLVYVGHVNALKDDLTALENLDLGATLAGRAVHLDAARAALETLGIALCADLPVRVLSQGQRRRVALARLVLSKAAPLWVLDEPFTALDTGAIAAVQKVIGEHVMGGGLAIFTTHQEVPIISASRQHIELGSC